MPFSESKSTVEKVNSFWKGEKKRGGEGGKEMGKGGKGGGGGGGRGAWGGGEGDKKDEPQGTAHLWSYAKGQRDKLQGGKKKNKNTKRLRRRC